MNPVFCYMSSVALFFIVLNNVLNHVCCLHQTNGVVSLTKSLVWGPGLDVDIVVPVRYFFVQPVDTEGHKYASDIVNTLRQWLECSFRGATLFLMCTHTCHYCLATFCYGCHKSDKTPHWLQI